MQTLTLAMFNTDTVLVLIGATRQHFELDNQHNQKTTCTKYTYTILSLF